MALLARLKPFDGKRFVRRSVTVFGIKFIGDRGWYRVDDSVADYIRTIVQRDEDPDSPPAFDVCTDAEAHAIDEREKKHALRRDAAQAEDARPAMRVHNVARPGAAAAARAALEATSGDLTTSDLRSSKPIAKLEEILGPADAAPELSGEFDDDMAGDPDDAEHEPPRGLTASATAPIAATKNPPPKKPKSHKPNPPKKATELL